MFLLGTLICALGMLCLALTQSKQAKLLVSAPPVGRTRTLTIWAGSLLLAASAWLGVVLYGFGVGLTTFAGWACIAAWAVLLLLTARRR